MKFGLLRSVFFVLLTAAGVCSLQAAPTDTAKADDSKTETVRPDPTKIDYVLQPLDVIRVLVAQEDDLTREVRITQECTVDLPYIGTIDLKGKTVAQARQMIRDLYDRDYLVNPQVTVIVVEYARRLVYVVGQVNDPGPVEFPRERGLTIVEAISLAKGQTRLAKLSRVTLKRTKPDGTTESMTIDVEALMKGEGGSENWQLQPGDVITVPERSI